mgnify:FL=1
MPGIPKFRKIEVVNIFQRLFFKDSRFVYFLKMKIKIPLQLIELEDENYHLVVASVFEDKSYGYWVLDTGASKTVFDKNLSEKYSAKGEETDQLHTAGIGEHPIETRIAHLHPFSLGKLNVNRLRVALLDLSHINHYYSGAANMQICGLLGSDFLMKYQAVVNYRKRILFLRNPK